MTCATSREKLASDEGRIPGGNCFWAVHEGGSECVVEVGTESRTRVIWEAGDLELHGVEGYGKEKWKCGEKRPVCGTEVVCTCPASGENEGVARVSTVNVGIQEVVLAALREKALESLQQKRNGILCASVGPEDFYREPDEGVLHRLNSGRDDKILSQFTCNPMPQKSVDGFLTMTDEGTEKEGRAHVRGTVNFGRDVGSIGEFVLAKRDDAWIVIDVSWRPYESQGQ